MKLRVPHGSSADEPVSTRHYESYVRDGVFQIQSKDLNDMLDEITEMNEQVAALGALISEKKEQLQFMVDKFVGGKLTDEETVDFETDQWTGRMTPVARLSWDSEMLKTISSTADATTNVINQRLSISRKTWDDLGPVEQAVFEPALKGRNVFVKLQAKRKS